MSEQLEPRLTWSPVIGKPPFILDPNYLPHAATVSDKLWVKITTDGLAIKCGSLCTLREAETMQFVSQNTSIKTPEVIAAYTLDSVTHIVMPYIEGKDLASFWAEATEEDQQTVLETLKQGLASMRSITADYVGGFNQNPCRAGEFEWDFHDHKRRYGPYGGDAAFHGGLIDALSRCSPTPLPQPNELPPDHWSIRLRHSIDSLKGTKTVLTHGDLNTGNIIIQEDLSVYIIDWDTAGFYPEYWEWYMATWMLPSRDPVFQMYEQFVPPFKAEAVIMRRLFDRITGWAPGEADGEKS